MHILRDDYSWRPIAAMSIESMKQGADFILIDVRRPTLFAAGYIPGAINIPHRAITAERMAEYPQDTLCVVYCAGPHCNGANKAAIRLTGLGYRVKEMIGGITAGATKDSRSNP